MEKPKPKVAKKKKFETITLDCDDASLARLTRIASLSGVTVSQVVSVMLAAYIVCDKEE